jgi:hypothetical protein
MKSLGTISVDFDATDQLLKDFVHSSDTRQKVGVQWDSTSAIHRFQESLWFSEEGSIAQYSYRVWNPHEIRLIKTCLNETYSKIRIGKHLSDSFPIQNGSKQWDALSPLIFNFALEYVIKNVREN